MDGAATPGPWPSARCESTSQSSSRLRRARPGRRSRPADRARGRRRSARGRAPAPAAATSASRSSRRTRAVGVVRLDRAGPARRAGARRARPPRRRRPRRPARRRPRRPGRAPRPAALAVRRGQRASTSASPPLSGSSAVERAPRRWPARRRRAAAARGTTRGSSAGVVGQAQQGEEVLDVRGLEVAQPAVLDVRDVAAARARARAGRSRATARISTACSRSAHRPARARRARARRPRSPGPPRRGRRPARARRRRCARRAAPCEKRASACAADGVGDVEQRLGGAVVALEGDHRRAGEVLGEREDVLGRRRAEAVDRLQVVADDGDVASRSARSPPDEVDLQAVDVLVLVDEQVVDAPRQLRADDRVLRQRAPVEQQVVEVDDAERALARPVVDEQPREVVGVVARTTGRPRPAARAAVAGR